MNLAHLHSIRLAWVVYFAIAAPCWSRCLAAEPTARGRVQQAIEDGQMAGAVVVLARDGRIIDSIVAGDAQTVPFTRPMRIDTVFDLASLTKPIATATSIMVLADRGRVDLTEPVARYWPAFAANGKASITLTDLLLHRGGLIADNALSDYSDDQSENWRRIAKLKPLANRGERFVYSDVGFQVLGKVVEEVSGQRLDAFAKQAIFDPLEMSDTMFVPTAALQERCAATERRGDGWLVGEVHDPRSARMEGVAGHAGLFSTAADLVRYGTAVIAQPPAEAENSEMPWLSFESRNRMREAVSVPRGTRGLGWDIRSPYSSNRPGRFSEAAFGHGGFTGTVLWIDPETRMVFVFLSNRLHPDGTGSVNRLAAEVADAMLAAAADKQ